MGIEPYLNKDLPERFLRWIETLRLRLRSVPQFTQGDGTPEGNLAGIQGDRYFRRDGSAGTFLYVKTTNGGNTGWLAYA